CLERADLDAADRPLRLSARVVARARLLERWRERPVLPFARSRWALRRVSLGAEPSPGGGSFTPARRAFDRPIALACFVDCAPCLPSRMCSISSWTNSPACVLGDFPSRASCRARSATSFSGMTSSELTSARGSSIRRARFAPPASAEPGRGRGCARGAYRRHLVELTGRTALGQAFGGAAAAARRSNVVGQTGLEISRSAVPLSFESRT